MGHIRQYMSKRAEFSNFEAPATVYKIKFKKKAKYFHFFPIISAYNVYKFMYLNSPYNVCLP